MAVFNKYNNMQTFLPYPSFKRSAKVLDRQRLGKQRVEAYQILLALKGKKSGWINHPAVKMWKGHENSLAIYGIAVCEEWTGRGYKDTCREKISFLFDAKKKTIHPEWIGKRKFHASHKSNLIRKDRKHYGKHFGKISGKLPYAWPVS